MRFADFINQNMARKAEKDKNLSRALLLTAEKDLAFFKGIEINENSARKIMTNIPKNIPVEEKIKKGLQLGTTKKKKV